MHTGKAEQKMDIQELWNNTEIVQTACDKVLWQGKQVLLSRPG